MPRSKARYRWARPRWRGVLRAWIFAVPSRAGSYVGVIGRRAVGMGTELGDLEVWTWPLKLLHGFNLRFQTPLYADPINGRDIARRVEITPAGATIIYSHPAFTVRERLFAAENESAVVMVLEVDAVRPIEIIAEFQSDLQLAWPAAFGGQYVFWDDSEKAFVLSESRRQANGFVGSPYTTSATNQPSHNVPEAPNQLRIAVGDQTTVPMPRPGEPAGRLTHVHAERHPHRHGRGHRAARFGAGHLPAGTGQRPRALRGAGRPCGGGDRQRHVGGDAGLARSTWASAGPRSTWTRRWSATPISAAGSVAGYGPSGARGTRPGFAWFFGGDASINSLGMTGAGQFDLARQGLEFFVRYQNAAGKIPHEISQSAGRIRWFEDYPYAFYHADTTPFWIMAWGDYWLASGDTASVRRVWPAIRRAFDWCRGTVDSTTGLMLNSKGGLGAIEVGDLGVGVESDIYLSGVWVVALERIGRMAAAVNDRRAVADAQALLVKARGQPARSLLAAGAAVLRLRPSEGRRHPAGTHHLAVDRDELRRVRRGAGNAGRPVHGAGHAQHRLGSPGARGGEPAVRSAALQQRHGLALRHRLGRAGPVPLPESGGGVRRRSAPSCGRGFTWGLGRNPEVWSGSQYEPLETAVPHQFFGTSFHPDGAGPRRARLGAGRSPGHGAAGTADPCGMAGNDGPSGPCGPGAVRSCRSTGPPDVPPQLPPSRRARIPCCSSPTCRSVRESSRSRLNGAPVPCEVRVTPRDTQPVCRLAIGDTGTVVVQPYCWIFSAYSRRCSASG